MLIVSDSLAVFQEVGLDEIAIVVFVRGDHPFQVELPDGGSLLEVMHEPLQDE